MARPHISTTTLPLATASWSLVHGLAFLHLDGKLPSANAEEVEARVTAAITAILALRGTV